MTFAELKVLLAEHAAAVILTAVLVSIAVWAIASLHHKERITVLETRIQHLEKRLAEPAPFASPVPPQSASAPSSSSATAPQSSRAGRRYPSIANPASLSRSEVEALASFYDLRKDWPTNPHLRFLDGDIAYWHEQALTEARIKAEFEARRQVLEEAEQQRRRIPKQGDLSHLANEKVPLLLGR